MSRSYRKPYASVTGTRSRKHDRTLASRAYRRLANFYLRTNPSNDTFLLPHRYNAAHNDCWVWTSDGKPHLVLREPQWHSWPWIADERREQHREWWLRIQRK